MYYMASFASGENDGLCLAEKHFCRSIISRNGQSGTLQNIQNELIKEYAL